MKNRTITPLTKTRHRPLIIWAVAVALVSSFLVAAAPAAGPAQALSGSEFNAGNIISDANFYTPNAMSEVEIQSFLDANIGSCLNTLCLNVLRINTVTTTLSFGTCATYVGAPNESAARMIFKVQQACSISAKVLLVTLQKEQGLITSRAPTEGVLRKALGQGCPDTAQCDSAYYGFFMQVYSAARQFAWYGNPEGSHTSIKVGQQNAVRYHPHAACGSSSVLIQNRATASLYYYTPYQPNAAALGNLGGTGDACSSYGNRNFWVYYNNWFGSPHASAAPVGSFDAISATAGRATVRGWAFDYDTPNAIAIHAYSGSTFLGGWATTVPRTDVQLAYPSRGLLTGFNQTIAINPGARQICLFALNNGAGGNTSLGCKIVTVPSTAPIGWFDSATATSTGVAVRGWALDPTTAASTSVHVYVDGAFSAGFAASNVRSDVGSQYPALGSRHGFASTIALNAGRHSVCAYALNVAGSQSTSLGCRTVTIAGPAAAIAKGNLDAVTATASGANVAGWAFDTSTAASTDVHVYADGRFLSGFTASGTRTDVGAVYPKQGSQHGFSQAIALTPGNHSVCVYALTAARSSSSSLGCRSVTVASSAPRGYLDSVQGVSGGAQVRGWALDPTNAASTAVHVYVDGQFSSGFSASVVRGDVLSAYPNLGANHGFDSLISLTPGSHSVCVFGLNASGTASVDLGCSTVTTR